MVVNKKSLEKLNILHVVGGKTTNGAFKGAYILHKALLKQNVKSKIINDTKKMNSNREIVHFDNYFLQSQKSLFIFIEKILKKFFYITLEKLLL